MAVPGAERDSERVRLVRRNSPLPTFAFSADQRSVIDHLGSPLTVFGGPGTGKTTVLVESVVARVKAGVDPNSILILTYGRERASELRDAIAIRAKSSSFEPLARTFHALAFSILNEKLAGASARYVLASGAEQDLAISQMLNNPLVTIPWHPDLKVALSTRGFVREVRDLMLRATEWGLTPRELIAHGKVLDEKYWEGFAHFWSSYFGAQELKSGTVGEQIVRIDPSSIINEAIYLLEADASRLELFRKRFTTIIVDEFHESDHAQRRLLQLLAPSDLLIFADPQSAVGRFRGADPDSVRKFLSDWIPQSIHLNDDFRSVAAITALTDQVAHGFAENIKERRALRSEQGSDAITLAKLTSPSENAAYIAHALRHAHLREGVPWSEMAVLVRSPGSEVAALQRSFAQSGIPFEVSSTAMALAENPAVLPLLHIATLALNSSRLAAHDWPIIEEVLLSEFGGSDSLELRQMRLLFAAHRDSEGSDHRSATEMMIDALTEPTAELPWEQIAPLKRINDLLKAARSSLRKRGDISDLLWAIWNSAKDREGRSIADVWRKRALAGGAWGATADRDLDAVIQLFEVARRFVERNQGASPQLFISQLMNERIVSDAITSSALRSEVVTIETVHSAKGREWELVVVTGLQEGSWPNLKERGSLLGSERLVESLRSGLTARAEIAASASAGLALDERRLLYAALSRARSRLIVTAISEEDSHPSRYFEELCEYHLGHSSEELVTHLPRQITAQSLVATLRREAEGGSEFAGRLLARLQLEGVRGAEPGQWLGVRAISSEEPVIAPDKSVHISPSALTSFADCGLKWFLERSGAQDGDSSAQLLGVAIHYIASELHTKPGLTFDEALEQLESAWPVVDQNVGWIKTKQLRDATRMLERLFEWHEANNRELIFVEKNFALQIGRAELSGSVDRLERDPATGKYFVVDIKTGASVTKAEAEAHKQLKAYQLGVVQGGFSELPAGAESAGAGLLFLKKDTEKNVTVDQRPVVASEFSQEIEETAEAMAASTFNAVINKKCSTCAVRSMCPLQSEGRSVVE